MLNTKLFCRENLCAAKYFIITFIISAFAFMLLRFPETAGQGISDGIDLCLGTLIPSLFPFMFVSSLAVNLNLFDFAGKYISRAMNFIFSLPGKSLGIILMSMIGGYPVGGKIIKEMHKRGEITCAQGKRLLLFCVNPGPAFVISSVGFYMLGSKTAGIVLYLSVILSTFILCFASRFFTDNEACTVLTEASSHSRGNSLSKEIVTSISTAGKAMLEICSWVIIFSCISRIIDIAAFSPGTKLFLNCVLEVTNGCSLSAGNLTLPAIACVIGFGGICTHFQIMDAVREVGLRYKHFITSRIIHGSLSAVICNLILKFIPISYDVFSFGTLPSYEASAASVWVSLGLIILSAFAMLNDSLKIKIKRKN